MMLTSRAKAKGRAWLGGEAARIGPAFYAWLTHRFWSNSAHPCALAVTRIGSTLRRLQWAELGRTVPWGGRPHFLERLWRDARVRVAVVGGARAHAPGWGRGARNFLERLSEMSMCAWPLWEGHVLTPLVGMVRVLERLESDFSRARGRALSGGHAFVLARRAWARVSWARPRATCSSWSLIGCRGGWRRWVGQVYFLERVDEMLRLVVDGLADAERVLASSAAPEV